MRAELVWERVLQPALAWEHAHPGQFVHKGTPYYFWAMTAILGRDMDRGYLAIHRALEEDIRTHRQARPRGPSFLSLANALSALYPKGSEEKRLLDAMLLAMPR